MNLESHCKDARHHLQLITTNSVKPRATRLRGCECCGARAVSARIAQKIQATAKAAAATPKCALKRQVSAPGRWRGWRMKPSLAFSWLATVKPMPLLRSKIG